jgi:hypothetical protein
VWQKQRDTVQSEEHIKEVAAKQISGWLGKCDIKNVAIPCTFDQYLRPTDSQITSDLGAFRYSNYLWRAKWYPYPLDTHDQALGMINNQPATFGLTPSLEYLEQDATNSQESLDTVLNEINSQQIVVSRIGLLGEVTTDPVKPFNIAFYNAENITDWRVDIDASGEELVTWVKLLTDEFLDDKPIFLILMLDNNLDYVQYKTTNEKAKPELWGVSDEGFIQDSFIMPMVREQPTKTIPFVTINLSRLGLDNVQKPWLESISDSALKLFQASATYEDTLYWGAQSTFWATGYKKPAKGDKSGNSIKLGNGGAVISGDKDTKFGYASAGTDGISPNKENVDNLKADCVALGVDLINQGVESGVALETRMSVKTASLKTLAKTGAEGLQRLLRICADWLGETVEDIKVIPNLEFADKTYTAEELEKLGQLVEVGKYRIEDLHSIYKRQKMTASEDFEEWKADVDSSLVDTGNEVPPL